MDAACPCALTRTRGPLAATRVLLHRQELPRRTHCSAADRAGWPRGPSVPEAESRTGRPSELRGSAWRSPPYRRGSLCGTRSPRRALVLISAGRDSLWKALAGPHPHAGGGPLTRVRTTYSTSMAGSAPRSFAVSTRRPALLEYDPAAPSPPASQKSAPRTTSPLLVSPSSSKRASCKASQ